MKYSQFYSLLVVLLIAAIRPAGAQLSKPFLSNLSAGPHAPLYTGYAAAMQRSAFALDEGYRFQYDLDSAAVAFITDKAGNLALAFKDHEQWIIRASDLYKKPVIAVSYPDMMECYYYPLKEVRVEITFVVHSSTDAFWKVKVINESNSDKQINLTAYINNLSGVFKHIQLSKASGKIYFTHIEKADGWTLDHHLPHVDSINNLFSITGNINQIAAVKDYDFTEAIFNNHETATDTAHIIAFDKNWQLKAHQADSFRLCRVVQPAGQKKALLDQQADSLKTASVENYKAANEKLFSRTPPAPFKDKDAASLYWSACSMMRQVFYPPEGNLKHNYYVFSREPQWGWGHGGQVFHESISILAYAYIDPESAMNSMRVFAERQHPNGYINYRTGAYLDEVIKYKGELTSSAPWYSWLNWEVYKVTKDTAYLRQMYQSSKRFYEFYTSHRDSDHDGLCEWGGEAVLESVRDALVAVWDQVGYPANFESLDLNCMLVMEAKSLEKMAKTLHLPGEAAQWKKDYQTRSRLINQTFWDPVNHFYYNVDKINNSFTFKKKNDLKRNEIIGFMPLWAGVASKKQAAFLVQHLTDTAAFWRPYGVPSLAANDPYYNPRGYWNGPVWIQWDYLIERGLLDYGYKKQAGELVQKVMNNMIAVLKDNHELWEFYDPDTHWGGYHRTYIWAGIINRMMMDLQTHEK